MYSSMALFFPSSPRSPFPLLLLSFSPSPPFRPILLPLTPLLFSCHFSFSFLFPTHHTTYTPHTGMDAVVEYLAKVDPEDAKKAKKAYSNFDRFQGGRPLVLCSPLLASSLSSSSSRPAVTLLLSVPSLSLSLCQAPFLLFSSPSSTPFDDPFIFFLLPSSSLSQVFHNTTGTVHLWASLLSLREK